MKTDGPLRLLIVEDSEDDAELLRLQLQRQNLPIEEYRRVDNRKDMEQALAGQPWDIVISDHNMPGFSAIAALDILKSTGIDIPFIIVSGAIGEHTAVEAMRAGAHDYILKDNLARLEPAIRREIGEAEVRRRRREAEEESLRFHQRLKILHEIDRALLAARSTEEIAAPVLRQLCRLLDATNSVLLNVEKRHEGTAYVLARVTRRPDASPEIDLNGDGEPVTSVIRLDPSQSFKEILTGTTLITTRPEENDPLYPFLRSLELEREEFVLLTPIIIEENLFGILLNTAHRHFSSEEVEIAQELADQLGVALHQRQLREKIERHAQELEQRVLERTHELQEVNRELEAFTHSVSHDLRAPLRAVQGFAEALYEGYAASLNEEGKTFLASITEGTRRMDALIQDLLTYSQLRLQGVRLWPVSLDSTVAIVLDKLHNEIIKRDAKVTVVSPLPRVTGDQDIISEILRALLCNALIFVPKGVTPEITIRAENQVSTVRLWIEDNGIGIDPIYQERIFDIFERLHPSDKYEGNGIGLAIVRKGMERMGGTSGVESDGTSGSKFWIEWPKKINHEKK